MLTATRPCLALAFMVALAANVSQADAQQSGPLRLYSEADARQGRLVIDPNGFLLNPRWLHSDQVPDMEAQCRFRVSTGHLDRRSLFVTKGDCLSADERRIVTLEEARSTLGLGAVCATGNHTGVRGHVNWFPVTATGQLVWNSFSAGAADRDVNVDLITPSPSAVTRANHQFEGYGRQRGYHLEFYSYETLDRLPVEGRSFWHSLRRSLADKERARGLVNDRFAIATGIYGVDGVHGFHAELHPVFALSVLEDVKATSTGRTERWAVMVRNLGSEGDCSSGTIPMITSSDTSANQEFVIDLGARAGAGGATVSMEDSWTSGGPEHLPRYRTETPSGESQPHVYLRFPHPRPRPGEPDFVFLGTITVTWTIRNEDPWESHFLASLPREPRQPVKVDPIDQALGSEGDTSTAGSSSGLSKPAKGMPGYDVYGRRAPELLRYHAPRPLRFDSAIKRAPLRAERSPSWPVADKVEEFCTDRTDRGSPLCLSGRRLLLGLGDLRPVIGVHVLPHSIYVGGEGKLAEIVNYLGVLGYRFEARKDAFRTVAQTAGGPTELLRGGSLRFTPFLSPSIVWTSSNFSASPYTMSNVGVSWVKGREGDWTWGWGIGMNVEVWHHKLFLEGQNMVRRGDFESEWVFSFGWLAGLLR